MKQLAVLTALAVCAVTAQAAPQTYVIDSSRTSSAFSYRYLGGASQTNRFERISGKVVFDAGAGTGAADVTIDATSVDTGHALLDRMIQDADFFDTGNYPAITFRSGSMTLDGAHPSLAGKLTIKGVTRPVTLAVTRFECNRDADSEVDTCGAHATVTIRRSDFNMGKHRLLVSNDITLDLRITAVREAPSLQMASRDPDR